MSRTQENDTQGYTLTHNLKEYMDCFSDDCIERSKLFALLEIDSYKWKINIADKQAVCNEGIENFNTKFRMHLQSISKMINDQNGPQSLDYSDASLAYLPLLPEKDEDFEEFHLFEERKFDQISDMKRVFINKIEIWYP